MQHNIPRLYQMNRLRHDVDLSNFIICLCIVNVNQRKKDDTESLFELYPFMKKCKSRRRPVLPMPLPALFIFSFIIYYL
jgi:hypothetical protein